MATRVAREKIQLAAFDGPPPKTTSAGVHCAAPDLQAQPLDTQTEVLVHAGSSRGRSVRCDVRFNDQLTTGHFATADLPNTAGCQSH